MGGIENFKKRSADQMDAFEKIWEENGKNYILGAEPHDMASVWFSEGVAWQSEQIKALKEMCENFRTGLRNIVQFTKQSIHIDAHRIAASVPSSIIQRVTYVCAECNGYVFVKDGYDHKAECPECKKSDKVAVQSLVLKDVCE